MARDTGAGPLRALLFIGLAVAAGSASLVMLHQLITGYQVRIDQAKRPEDTVMVIVAARDLYQGVTITEDDLYAVQISPKYLPEGVFLSPEHVVGRIPRERVLANEFLRADRLADPESGVGLNAVIPRGMRAVSINLGDGAALSGFLSPANYVDVLVTVLPDDDDPNGLPQTRTLLQAVFVLGVDSRMGHETAEQARERRAGGKPTVTLLVTADQAEQIAHAEKLGDIVLTLRTDVDLTIAPVDGVDIRDLRRVYEAPKVARTRVVAPPPPRDCHELTVVLGDDKQVRLVDESGVPCE